MQRTYTSTGVIYVGELEVTRLLVHLIKHHKFLHDNVYPEKIVMPAVKEIEGVIIEQGIIEQETRNAVTSRKSK